MIWPRSLTATAGLALDAARIPGALWDALTGPLRVRVLRGACRVGVAQEIEDEGVAG